MNWNKLKSMKCPKCGDDVITSNFGRRGYGCEGKHCDFFISPEKFDRLVAGLYKGYADKGYKPKFGDDVDALRELNNLGHEEINEGFL